MPLTIISICANGRNRTRIGADYTVTHNKTKGISIKDRNLQLLEDENESDTPVQDSSPASSELLQSHNVHWIEKIISVDLKKMLVTHLRH